MTTSCALLLCLTLLSAENMSVEKTETRARNCIELAQLAADQKLDPLMVISIAHTESRFSKVAVSSAGAIGMASIFENGLKTNRAWYFDIQLVYTMYGKM